MEKKINIIDLFAGCGGLTEGFEKTEQYRTICCIEWDKYPALTLENRLKTKWKYSDANKRVIRFDIQRTEELLNGWKNDKEYGSNNGLDHLVKESGTCDLIIGGPPCQAYSIAGRIRDKYGMKKDYRNYLFESYLRIVKYFKPKIVVFENVPGMLSAAPGNIPVVERIYKEFDSIGYELITNIKNRSLIDFTQFGIPQKRKRVILIALNRSFFKKNCQGLIKYFYDNLLPTYHKKNRATVYDAIGDLPKLKPAKEEIVIRGKRFSHKPIETDICNHVPRFQNRRDISIFRDLANDLKTKKNKYVSIENLKQLYIERTGKVSNIHKYYVLRWEEPSNLIPAHLYKDGLRHIHPDPEQARTITVREAARLQTFDDDFIFLGGMGSQYKMIGNAVSPLFAKALAKAIIDLLKLHKN